VILHSLQDELGRTIKHKGVISTGFAQKVIRSPHLADD
jgi:hypothetical protein